MGLNIYFYRVKKSVVNNIDKTSDKYFDKVVDAHTAEEQKEFKKQYNKFVKRIKAITDRGIEIGSDEYKENYIKVMNTFIAKMGITCPQYTLYDIGVRDNFPNSGFTIIPQEISHLKKELRNVIKNYYPSEILYYRKVNFIYAFFSNKLTDEMCEVTKEDVEELIERCEKVLADNSMANEYLPTRDGFFFGRTDYDEWYYSDVKRVLNDMKQLLSTWDDDSMYYVEMNW